MTSILSRPGAHASNRMREAWTLAFPAVVLAYIVTPVRFTLEYIGISEIYIFLIGLLWLTLGFSIYWGLKLATSSAAYVSLFVTLLIFAPLSRIPVFLAWWFDTTYDIGTHYNIFDNWIQALVSQLFYGSLVQIIPGFIN